MGGGTNTGAEEYTIIFSAGEEPHRVVIVGQAYQEPANQIAHLEEYFVFRRGSYEHFNEPRTFHVPSYSMWTSDLLEQKLKEIRFSEEEILDAILKISLEFGLQVR